MTQDSPSTARKTGGQPSKLVDLGAAATFAQQSAPTKQGASGLAQQGLFFGDTPSQQPQKTSGGGDGFADFEAAFKGPPEESQAAGEFVPSSVCLDHLLIINNALTSLVANKMLET